MGGGDQCLVYEVITCRVMTVSFEEPAEKKVFLVPSSRNFIAIYLRWRRAEKVFNREEEIGTHF